MAAQPKDEGGKADTDSEIVADLPPGLYTTIVTGKAASGVGLNRDL